MKGEAIVIESILIDDYCVDVELTAKIEYSRRGFDEFDTDYEYEIGEAKYDSSQFDESQNLLVIKHIQRKIEEIEESLVITFNKDNNL